MKPTRLNLHTGFTIGAIDPRIYGGFLEHLGRAIYEGVYDPASRHADGRGFRRDVMDALRPLGFTAMRYPGGNFASGYHWMDGIGPREKRPRVRELAWQSTEPNTFGTGEFIELSRELGWTPMVTVNLGTGTPEEARNWVEYCNCPAGTKYADLRAAGGHRDPYAVKLWCLGNEMDGPWQLGHVPAAEYAVRAQQAAKMMKDADRSVELVACGSCTPDLASYMEWDRTILEYLGDYADYVSLHRYVGNRNGDTPAYLGIASTVDRQIEEMDAVCRYVQARRRSRKRTMLCFDEWNVWYRARSSDGEGKVAPHLLEEVYNLEDALVVAGFLNSFLRHADVLKIANLAQIVNVIAPIMTSGDALVRQTIYYPFEMHSRRRGETALRVATDGPTYQAGDDTVPYVDAAASLDRNRLHLFLVNRSLTERAAVTVEPADRAVAKLVDGETLCGTDPKAANTFGSPESVRPRRFAEVKVSAGKAALELDPLSVTALTLELA
jgi:alpha-L-arabinofuranosidase